MIEYRMNKFGREFFKINGEVVTRVLNKELLARIEISKSYISTGDALDPGTTSPCTEAEYLESFKEARDRILLDRL
jgi:hypothetical protein